MISSILELDAGAYDQVFDRGRNKDLTGTSQRAHSGSYVDSKTPQILTSNFTLSGMKSHSKLNSKIP